MDQIIINDQFYRICDNDDIVKILICQEDDQEMLVFRIDVTEFDSICFIASLSCSSVVL